MGETDGFGWEVKKEQVPGPGPTKCPSAALLLTISEPAGRENGLQRKPMDSDATVPPFQIR